MSVKAIAKIENWEKIMLFVNQQERRVREKRTEKTQ